MNCDCRDFEQGVGNGIWLVIEIYHLVLRMGMGITKHPLQEKKNKKILDIRKMNRD